VQGPIPLASKNYINGDKRGTVSGWGKIKENERNGSKVLRWISVNVLSQEHCLQSYKNPRTNENQICTLKRIGIGACQVKYFYTYFFILYIIYFTREDLSMHTH